MGTGGSISGTAKFLKEKNPAIRVIGIDPIGSVFKKLKETGKMGEARPYLVEGVGEDFVPSTIDMKIIDEVIQVDDREAFLMTRQLVQHEGLFVGGSCGLAVAGALKWASKEKSKHFPVVILPDSGSRYMSKIFNDDWMREKGLLD
jgi:cystathionine beta-synthase